MYIHHRSLSSPASARDGGEEKINKKKDFSLVSLSSLDDRWEELQTERVWLLCCCCLFFPLLFSFFYSLERLYFITTQTSRVECVGMGQTFSSAVLSHTLLRLVLSVGGRHCLSRNCKYICEFRAVAVDVVDDRRLEFLQTTSKEDWEGAQRLFVGVLIDQHTHLLWWNTSSVISNPINESDASLATRHLFKTSLLKSRLIASCVVSYYIIGWIPGAIECSVKMTYMLKRWKSDKDDEILSVTSQTGELFPILIDCVLMLFFLFHFLWFSFGGELGGRNAQS
jgi:hypothetical protein